MQELVHEVLLTFARHLWRDGGHHLPVLAVDVLFEFKQAHLQILLVWDVVVFAHGAEVVIHPHPCEKAILAYLVAVLSDDFRQLSDET